MYVCLLSHCGKFLKDEGYGISIFLCSILFFIMLGTLFKSVFDRKPVTSKSKGEIITPKNKMKLQKLVKLKKQYLGDIDISNIKDLSFLFEDVVSDEIPMPQWIPSHPGTKLS